MHRVTLVEIGHAAREKTESFVRDVYHKEYGAVVGALDWPLITLVDDRGSLVCAAGLRTEQHGFFSERYLDAPIQDVLSSLSKSRVSRGEVFEVSTLTSRAPHLVAGLIGEIIAFGQQGGFCWSFFTLTSRLSRLVERLGLAPTFLETADRRRIEDAERWGSYYATEPKVFAVEGASLARQINLNKRDRQPS